MKILTDTIFLILFISAGISFTVASERASAPVASASQSNSTSASQSKSRSTASASDRLISKIYENFPSQLSKIKIDQTTRKEMKDALGEAPKQDDKGNYFYDLSGIKYDTTVSLKDETVSSIIYSLPFGKLVLKDISPHIPEEILERASQFEFTKAQEHEFGRTFDILMENLNLRIVVSNNTKKSIKSIYMWSDRVE